MPLRVPASTLVLGDTVHLDFHTWEVYGFKVVRRHAEKLPEIIFWRKIKLTEMVLKEVLYV